MDELPPEKSILCGEDLSPVFSGLFLFEAGKSNEVSKLHLISKLCTEVTDRGMVLQPHNHPGIILIEVSFDWGKNPIPRPETTYRHDIQRAVISLFNIR
ncbi:hypothetical protein Y1Q_0009542 [Alligator mississippiensis]|uniref:Uncharacterized protein n=1 Tax=Alligator mississippiensis TaxID=8496 RepID=A0A151NV08_ALLMI|nr:hypothetical protein Y1Q_0009542 [Alligator mississippiensis]